MLHVSVYKHIKAVIKHPGSPRRGVRRFTVAINTLDVVSHLILILRESQVSVTALVGLAYSPAGRSGMNIASSDPTPQVQTKPTSQKEKADLHLDISLAGQLPLPIQETLLLQAPRAFFPLSHFRDWVLSCIFCNFQASLLHPFHSNCFCL